MSTVTNYANGGLTTNQGILNNAQGKVVDLAATAFTAYEQLDPLQQDLANLSKVIVDTVN